MVTKRIPSAGRRPVLTPGLLDALERVRRAFVRVAVALLAAWRGVARVVPALLRAAAHALTRTAAGALSPRRCSACDEPLTASAVFCAPCASSVVRLEPSPQPARGIPLLAFAAYGGALADALRRLKYRERPDLAAPLGELLRLTARHARLRAEVIVPVPLHPRRLAERGYNQAALLARALRLELEAPVRPTALRRLRDTHQQAGLDPTQRAANVAGAFQVRSPRAVRDRDVLLVDDVATTGATLLACTEALHDAGARSVTSLVVARADGINRAVVARRPSPSDTRR